MINTTYGLAKGRVCPVLPYRLVLRLRPTGSGLHAISEEYIWNEQGGSGRCLATAKS